MAPITLRLSGTQHRDIIIDAPTVRDAVVHLRGLSEPAKRALFGTGETWITGDVAPSTREPDRYRPGVGPGTCPWPLGTLLELTMPREIHGVRVGRVSLCILREVTPPPSYSARPAGDLIVQWITVPGLDTSWFDGDDALTALRAHVAPTVDDDFL